MDWRYGSRSIRVALKAGAAMPFIIKTAPFDAAAGETRTIVEKTMYGGNKVTRGQEAFVWFSEGRGRHGLAWRGVIDRVEPLVQRRLGATVLLRDRYLGDEFGKAQLEPFSNVNEGSVMAGLARKLHDQRHHKIAELSDQEAVLLRHQFASTASFNRPSHASEEGAQREIARLKRLAEVASRPHQRAFSAAIRRAYGNKCAITGCSTAEALEAAHIRTEAGRDYNDRSNGILLRADIHALFDEGLITLIPDGKRLEVSPKMTDTTYDYLRDSVVALPAPARANILHHRRRFGFST